MYISQTKIRVRYVETDQMGVVYHSNFFHYFEAARAEAIRELGYTYADMEQAGVIMPVVEVYARYIRPALYDDLLTVKVILKELPLRYKIEFEQEVYNAKEELLVVGRVILYFLDAKTKNRNVMPDTLLKKLESYFK